MLMLTIDSLSSLCAKRDWIYHRHDSFANQKYNDNLPYSFHLESVLSFAKKYINIARCTDVDVVYVAAMGHDLIEDARVTYDNCVEMFGETVAEIIYSCTELRGHNREERHGPLYYQGLKENNLGLYVKLCDLMANISFGIATNSSMVNKYRKEFPVFVDKLYHAPYDPMFKFIESLLKIK